MFARVLSADVPSHRRDRDMIAKKLSAEVLPVVAKEPGFKGVWFLLDHKTGKLMSVTLYDTQTNMRKAHDDIKEFRSGILGALGASHVDAESMEVIASRPS
jgi:hypothetical protein